MSSHREAPEISKDPVADSTDVYAFRSPDRPDSITLIANYIPLQQPSGGPNFFEFDDDVLYEIHIDNTGDGRPDVTYAFRFTTEIQVGGTFLYNVGPIQSIDSPNWNRRQFYSVTRIDRRSRVFEASFRRQKLGEHLPSPPCNIGPLSTPDYLGLVDQATHDLPGGIRVFAGQRAEGFYVDLGSVFDLANLRPFQQLHTQFGLNIPELTRPAPGVNATKAVNVHSIAIQVPINQLTRNRNAPSDVLDPSATIGVWTTASRQKVRIFSDRNGDQVDAGPFSQISRLGNPLFNEVLVPMERKDYWNTQGPEGDAQFADGVRRPELAQLLPGLYPDVFPSLAALNASGKSRDDLVAILLTGIPKGVVDGFQNSAGSTLADELRLNVAVPPASTPNNIGLIAGDAAGFPNGRRVFDDVFTIELRAIAGVTYPLIDPSFVPDGAAGAVTDGLTASDTDQTADGTVQYLDQFPYLGTPHSGYEVPAAEAS
jgi:Domain of unknown function (DUF4331)